jgi:hypothetical protein
MHAKRATLASAIAVMSLGSTGGPTWAQTICWEWELVDTAGNTGFVDGGESAILKLWGSFDPINHGFAQAGPYDITGDTEWANGTVDAFSNDLFFSVGFGTLGAGNSITGIENFQLNELFNSGYRDENPIQVYTIEWTPDRYEGQFATITNSSPDAYVYTNDLGASELYTGDPDCGAITFQILPAPGGMAVFGLGLLTCGCLRRRSRC